MNIGIISLGLIGGSLFKCLSETGHNIYAVTQNKDTVEKAKKYSKYVFSDVEALSVCDIVFIASPIRNILDVLDSLEGIVSSGCIVLDCASVKEFVMKKARPYKFIGSHPMAGTEFNGFDASFKELFEGAKWVLTPSENINDSDIEKVKSVINLTKAETVICSAKEHDMAVALISHMPMLISQALFKNVENNELALKLAAGGFRDMTRLAMSNPVMAADMLQFNGCNIEKSLEMLSNSVNNLKNTKYFENITDIKNTRSKMYSSEGKNIL